MTVAYFRALAQRCQNAARDSFDLGAKEELRALAREFNAKADQLDQQTAGSAGVQWIFGGWFPRASARPPTGPVERRAGAAFRNR
jgi:hypothetical protein